MTTTASHLPPAANLPVMRGDLVAELDRFVHAFPHDASAAYTPPQPHELAAFREGWSTLRRGDAAGAAGLLAAIGCEVVAFRDEPSGQVFQIVREHEVGAGLPGRGWGMYIHNPAGDTRTVVEVPHAWSDGYTQEIGAQLLRDTRAGALLVSGAVRNATGNGRGPGGSDMAHATGSIFDAAHRSMLATTGLVVQLHGFNEQRHIGYGDVVVSEGATPRGPAQSVAAALRRSGYDANAYDGVAFRALAGTRNVQGASTRAAGSTFLHVEASRASRATPELRARFSAALAAGISGLSQRKV